VAIEMEVSYLYLNLEKKEGDINRICSLYTYLSAMSVHPNQVLRTDSASLVVSETGNVRVQGCYYSLIEYI
jgi:hypothetical protein